MPEQLDVSTAGIGTSCCDLQQWANGLCYSQRMGEEELVDAEGGIVMLESDKSSVVRAVGDLMITAEHSVLEIGFGCGYSADAIQAGGPASHVIVECAPAVLERLRVWAEGRPSVTIVEGSWQSCLPSLGEFDRIFFDAGRHIELDAKEMAKCPHEKYRAEYATACQHADATVYDAFEKIALAWHAKAGALVTSGDGTEFRQWTNGFFYSHDKDGKQQLLDVDGMQVMMEWERPYMKECVDALSIDSTSDVLEVGFGCGYSADYIQGKSPRTHTIIECADVVLEHLHGWAKDKPSVRIIEGTWQARLPDLGKFDCIFFDDYGIPGRADREMERCTRSEYRDLYADTMNLYGGSHFEAFLKIALKWHAREGSRMSGFVMHQLVTIEEEGVEVHYREMEVSPPEHCNYFFSKKAIIPLFLKKGEASAGQDCSTSAGSPKRCSSLGRSSSSDRASALSRSRSRSRSSRRNSGTVPAADMLV